CAKVEPAKMPITVRDEMMYEDNSSAHGGLGGISEKPVEEQLTVAVLVAGAADSNEEVIYTALDAALTSHVSDFEFFTIVERSNVGALQREQDLLTLNADDVSGLDIGNADYLITAKLS